VKRCGIALVLAALLIGCGGDGKSGSDEEQIESTIKDYFAAFADGDGGKSCGLLTDEARAAMEKGLKGLGVGGSCEDLPKAMDQLPDEQKDQIDKLKDAEVTDIKVTGDTATAVPTLDDERGNEVKMRRVGDDWKIDADFFGGSG
jgi:Putative lumazine-binding